MSKIQCGGFDFDDSSFEMKTVNGQKVLSNKYGGVVTYKVEMLSSTDIRIYSTPDEIKRNVEKGNLIIFYMEPPYFFLLKSFGEVESSFAIEIVTVDRAPITYAFSYDEESGYFKVVGSSD